MIISSLCVMVIAKYWKQKILSYFHGNSLSLSFSLFLIHHSYTYNMAVHYINCWMCVMCVYNCCLNQQVCVCIAQNNNTLIIKRSSIAIQHPRCCWWWWWWRQLTKKNDDYFYSHRRRWPPPLLLMHWRENNKNKNRALVRCSFLSFTLTHKNNHTLFYFFLSLSSRFCQCSHGI